MSHGPRLSILMLILSVSVAAAEGYESSIVPALAGGCGDEIAAFRRVMESDAATGNMGRPVYNRMKPEVDRAAAACSGGRDAEALRMLAATKRRFGYR